MDNSPKNKNIKPTGKLSWPELLINRVLKKSTNWARHIPPVYWLIIVFVLFVFFSIVVPNDIWVVFLSRLKTQRVLVGLILIFGLVALSLVWSFGQRMDVWVFTYFNMHKHYRPWLDWTMLYFTQIGNGIFAIVIAILLYFSGNPLLAYALALGTLSLWLVVELIKVLIHRTRPYIKLANSRIVGSRARGSSFPSGHTSQSFFMATLLLHYYEVNFFMWSLMYAIALLVGITRIYLGMHYPRDVLGGAILGIAWGILGVTVNLT